jgi:putative hydrolase of the HAD superfamily
MATSKKQSQVSTIIAKSNYMNLEATLPKVIFFDAVGTLFGIKGSVGEIYGEIASKYGVIVSSQQLNHAFSKAFAQASPLAFERLDPLVIPQQEYQWWYEIVKSTFEQVDVLNKFKNFELFFQELYVYFATKKPWEVYIDTVNTLEKWQQNKVELGIVSNFDTRIYQVLELLKIKSYFTSITISSEVGSAKPNPIIFKTALAKHNCSPEQAWHIGDSLSEDYQGAKSVGIKAFLLERDKLNLYKKNQLPNLNSLG